MRVADLGGFRKEIQRRVPGGDLRSRSRADIQDWQDVRSLLRRVVKLLPRVGPSGAAPSSKVKTLGRPRSVGDPEADRILSSASVARFLYRGGPPVDLYRRLVSAGENYNAQLERLEANPDFANSWPPSLARKVSKSVATALAVLAAGGDEEEVGAVADNWGLDGSELVPFLKSTTSLAVAASNAYRHAKTIERKLLEHLDHHAGLPRPLTLLDLSED